MGTLLSLMLAAPALAEEPPASLDDRSDPASLVRSCHDAIARRDLAMDKVTSEEAAGSIHASVPVALREVSADGEAIVYAGSCVTRQVQPAIQEPAFQLIQIDSGHLAPATGPLEAAVPAGCPDP